jgi:hypothetical protein
MADSVGKGIALGERFKYDTTSGTSALNNAVQYKIASDKKKEADAVSSLDFKIDMNQWLPVYGKAAAEKQAEVYNKYLQYKSEDKNTAYNRIQQDIFKARQELGRLAGDNERAKKYLSQKEGLLRNAKVDNALTSTETTLDDLSKLSDGYFFNIGANGEFSHRPVSEINPASIVKYDAQDYNKVMAKTRPSKVPGKMDVEYVEELNPDAVRRNAEALVSTPGFVDNVIAADPTLLSLPEKDRLAASYKAAFDIATKLKRSSQSEWRLADLPNATSGGSDKDKREKPVIVKDTKQTLLTPTGETEEVKDPYNKVTTKAKKDNVESNILLSASVAKTPAITIPMDSRVIDATTNEYFSGEDLNQNVVFKPDNVYTEAIKKSGKWEKYVLGTATVNKVDRKGVKTERIITLKVPYDKVQSSIEGAYDLSEFDSQFEELRKIPVKEVKSNTPPKPTKGKLY